MIKVLINGANGKMGQEACQTVIAHPKLELAGKADRGDELAQVIQASNCDVVVELTNAKAVFANAKEIIELGKCLVVGASGLTNEQIAILSDLAAEKRLGVLIIPNFSISAVLMMQFAAQASKYFAHVEIIEQHHANKLDAPSGTAIRTAELIDKPKVNIHSVRLPGILAKQEVIFGKEGETLTISQQSISRSCFMAGLALSCEKVVSLKVLQVGLESILSL